MCLQQNKNHLSDCAGGQIFFFLFFFCMRCHEKVATLISVICGVYFNSHIPFRNDSDVGLLASGYFRLTFFLKMQVAYKVCNLCKHFFLKIKARH